MEEKYLVIYPSGKLAWAKLERKPRYNEVYNGEEALDIKDIAKVIDCEWCEQVYTSIPDVVMMVDEVGKVRLDPKPHNELASRLYYGWNPMHQDDIVGTVVLFALRPVGPLQEMELFPLNFNQLMLVCEKMGIRELIFTDEEVSSDG